MGPGSIRSSLGGLLALTSSLALVPCLWKQGGRTEALFTAPASACASEAPQLAACRLSPTITARLMWANPVLGAGKSLTGAPLLPKCSWVSPPETGGQCKPPMEGFLPGRLPSRSSLRLRGPGMTRNVYLASPPSSCQSGGICSSKFFVTLILYPVEPGLSERREYTTQFLAKRSTHQVS